MKRNTPSTSAKTERLTITLGDDQRRQIDAIARDRRTSSASIIRLAVDEFIAAHATNVRPHGLATLKSSAAGNETGK